MAVAYASKTSHSGGFGGTAGTTMALPSGTTAGELLILFYNYQGSSSSGGTFDASSNGGTMPVLSAENKYEDGGIVGAAFSGARYFFADATDISNGTIFIHSSDSYSYAGYAELYRISGATSTSLVTAVAANSAGDDTPTYTNTVTPVTPSGMLLFLVASVNTGFTFTGAGYACVTDNPSWTEIADLNKDDGGGQFVGVQTAWGTRNFGTATGDSSLTFTTGGGSTSSRGLMVSISDPLDATANISVATLRFSAPTIQATGGATATITATSLVITAPTIQATVGTPDWRNDDKSSDPAWTNPNKS